MAKHSDSSLEAKWKLVWMAVRGPKLVQEYQFHPTRRWRFDFAHLKSKVAIEIEGGVWGGGRHTRGAGFISDCDKYNEAVFAGWRVFRLTDKQITVPMAERLAEIMR